MNNYNNRGGRSGGYSGGGGYGRRDSGPREMHQATCDECGNTCQVPFRPSGNKPVYCSNCFETKGGGDSRSPRRSGGENSGRSDFGKRDNTSKQLLEQVTWLNSKLDRVLKVLETGVKQKPTVVKTKVKKVTKKVVSKVKKVKKVSKKK